MRELLIDGDILCYRFAHQHQQAHRWDEDTWAYVGDESAAKRSIDLWFAMLKDRLVADGVTVYISDSRFNWRHAVLPTYKGNRVAWKEFVFGHDELSIPKPGPARPILYKALREYLMSKWGAVWVDTLEADDLLGLGSTHPDYPGRVIVSPDKDMLTIPGLYFNPDRAQEGIRLISKDQADYNHMYQTLIGDSTDNYSGCPGIGPKKAALLLPEAGKWDGTAAWEAVVRAYEKADRLEEDALTMARIARVLRHGEYDFNDKQVKLWEPS